MITNRRLRHLLALVEHGHFGRAADALNISQPALSKSIQGLEAELGVTLLDRKRGGVALTAFGDLVLRRSQAMVHAEDDLRREIALLADLEVGALCVAMGPYPSMVSGYQAMGRLLSRAPGLDVAMRVHGWREVAQLVAARDVDLGLAELNEVLDDAQFTTELIGQHAGRVFCRPGHPILSLGQASLGDLLRFPWMAARMPRRVAERLPAAPVRAGAIDAVTGDFVPAVQVDVPMQVVELLSGCDALAFSSLALMARDLESGRIDLVPTGGMSFAAHYGFIHLKDRSLSPAAQAFMAEVRRVEADVVALERRLVERYRDRL